MHLFLLVLNYNLFSDELFISNHTTKAHVASIYKKLGVSNRVQAAVKSIKLGANELFNLQEVI